MAPLHTAAKTLTMIQDVDTDILQPLKEYDPLVSVMVALLIVAVTSLSTVVVFLFRMYARESKNKDEQIQDLNAFIRSSYHENTQILNDMVRVIDVLTHTTESVGEDVKGELRDFIMEMRNHLSTVQNIHALFKEQSKKREGQSDE